MLSNTSADAPQQASLIPGTIFMVVVTAAMWFGIWRFVRPALRSQEGRAQRMSRDERLRHVAKACGFAVYPVIFTFGLTVLVIRPGGETVTWIGSLVFWLIALMLMLIPVLFAVALIIRTIQRHQMRRGGRELGIADPKPPWLPWVAATMWVVSVVTIFAAASGVFWKFLSADIQGRMTLLESQMQTASQDPSVLALTRSGAPKTLVEQRMADLTGTSDQIAAQMTRFYTFAFGTAIAWIVMFGVLIVGGIYLVRRQRRLRAEYDARIDRSVQRASRVKM